MKDAARPPEFRLYREVADRIAGMMRDGALSPGDRLPSERTLAERMGVSRSTVREALIALEIGRAVEIRTNSGIYVAERGGLGQVDLGAGPLEVLDARELIEGATVRRAAEMMDSRQLVVIEGTVEAMAQAAGTDGHREADEAFHLALVATLRNEPLSEIVGRLWAEMYSPLFERMGTVTGLFGDPDDSALAHHRRIFDALAARDGPRAQMAMHAHLADVRRVLLRAPEVRAMAMRT